MRTATTAYCVLVLLSALALADFIVAPAQDSFDVLQNSSAIRAYLIQNNDTSGIIDISTSSSWVYDTTDYVNASPGKTYNAKVTFSPLMMPPGDYTVIVTFASKADTKVVKAQVKVVKSNWVYGFLLPGESYTDVKYENLTLENITYSLVLIKGADSFLIKNGKEIVKDTSEIRGFYESYYRQKYFPTDSEFSQVNGFVGVFNDSRNLKVKYSFGLGAEEACKQLTGITPYKKSTGKDCLTVNDATSACLMMNIEQPEACGDPVIIYGTMNLGIDLVNLDRNLSFFTSAMTGLSPENAAEKLLAAKGYLEKARVSALGANSSKLRWDPACRDCAPICPMIPYNISALDSAVRNLASLQAKASSIKSSDAQAKALLNSTNKRFSDVLGKEHKEGYAKRYEAVKPIAEELTKAVAESKTKIFNPDLDTKFSELKNATASLEWAIEGGDYSNITKLDAFFDSNMDKFYSTKSDVEKILLETNGIYDKVFGARQNASDFIIKAGMNVQPGDQAETELKLLRERIADADSSSKINENVPLRAELADSYFENYSGIAKEAKGVADTKPSSSILGRMVSKIVRTEKWIALSLTGFVKPMTLPEKTAVSEYVAPVTAGLLAMGLAGLLLSLLVVYALRNRRRLGRVRRQIALYSFFSVTTMLVALICLGLFYYLTLVYAGESTLNAFVFEINKAGGAAVFVDESTASLAQDQGGAKILMGECGEKIASSLKNYEPKVYYVDGAICRKGGQTLNYTDCDKEFSQLPVIYVRYGGKSLVSFRTLYAMNATYQGGEDWLKECYLAGALR